MLCFSSFMSILFLILFIAVRTSAQQLGDSSSFPDQFHVYKTVSSPIQVIVNAYFEPLRALEEANINRRDLEITDLARIDMQEPTFTPTFLITTNITEDRSLLQPGYIFIAPFGPTAEELGHGYGPMIYDMDGSLVWYGQESVGFYPPASIYGRAVNFRVCDYMGSKGSHLCWSESVYSLATNRFFDNTYRQVSQDFSRASGWEAPNEHEFQPIRDGHTFLQAVYFHRRMDLTVYGGAPDGFVTDACFQEVDVITGFELFRWCYLDHFPIWQTKIYMAVPANTANFTSHIAGNGTELTPWDFAHLNSAVLTEEGDYLISIRHNDQIIKIAGRDNVHGLPPGTPVWRLGGVGSDFDMDEPDGKNMFSRQHSARELSVSRTETQILLFNNAFEGDNAASSPETAVMIVVANNETWKAEATHRYPNPDGLLAYAEGGTHQTENGNIFAGWGLIPSLSEFSHDGELLYHALIYGAASHSYRAYKYPWRGAPIQQPKLLAYKQSCAADTQGAAPPPLYAYISWNGATEVKKYRFSLADSPDGPWISAGAFAKLTFETRVQLEPVRGSVHSAPWVRAEALDEQGNVLAVTQAQTWVPNEFVAGTCNLEGCFNSSQPFQPARFTYLSSLSMADVCPMLLPRSRSTNASLSSSVIVIILLMAAAILCARWAMRWLSRRKQVGYMLLADRHAGTELDVESSEDSVRENKEVDESETEVDSSFRRKVHF